MKEIKLRCSAASKRGAREENQDNLRFSDRCSFVDQAKDYADSAVFSGDRKEIFCVCDGVGGASKGDMASSGALMALKGYISAGRDETLEDRVRHGAQQAHQYVQRFYEQIGLTGGSTMAMAGICAGRYVTLNIGDSSIFLFRRRSGELTELSVRHNHQWLMCQQGREPIPDRARQLVHYLGRPDVTSDEQAHVCTGTLERGDALLLCSDGITDAFSSKEISKMMKYRVSAQRMVRMAARHRNADNCTAICIYAC